MNSREFAHIWLEKHGMFDADADYGGQTGRDVMAVVELIASQGHSGMSAAILYACLQAIYNEYASEDSPIWKEYWESPEGRKRAEEVTGERPEAES